MLAILLLVPLACPPTIVGGQRTSQYVGHAFASPYGLYLEERSRAPRSEPVIPDLPLWDLELALRELELSDPEARWAAWVLASAAEKPATAQKHLVAALADDSLSATRLLWWREQVVSALDARDALFDAWERATAPTTRALLATAIALALWESSCPVAPGPDGACRVSLDFDARGQIMRRDPIAVDEAKRWTARARELRRKLGSSDDALVAFEQQLALAAAAVDYEILLTSHIPEDLEFIIEEWRRDSGVPAWEQLYARQLRAAEDSRRRMGRFFDSTFKCTRTMSELHVEATTHGDAEVAMVAVLREAALAVALEDSIYGSGSTRELRRRDREKREHGPRWSTAHGHDDFYLDRARTLLEQCIEHGTAWGAAGETIDACFAWRSALDPERHPEQAELIPELVAHSTVQRHGLIAPAELDEHVDP